MKNSIKILVGAFASIGVVTTATSLSTLALAHGGVKPAFLQDKEKGEKEGTTKAMGSMDKPHAKISPVQALKAAEAKTGGKAKMAIFEFDEGHWIYGVIVAKNHKLMEVDVDPMTGKAGATEDVTPDDEAKEMKDALEKMTK